MPRPTRQITRSILETKSTGNARDIESNIKLKELKELKASETTLKPKNKKRINDDKQFFKLVLPPDLLKDLENSSEEMMNISSSRSTRKSRIKSVKVSPAIEISSSSGEDDFLHHNNDTLLEGNSSLVDSNNLSQEYNLSKPLRHKNKILYSTEEEIQKEIEMNNEDSDSDPFGFGKAEKTFKKKFRNEKFEVTTIDEDSQYNNNVQCEITHSISLNKEANENDTNGSGDFSEIDNQDQTQEKEENKASSENEDAKSSTGMSRKEEEEEEEIPSSKVRKTPNITKTADLLAFLPRRRHASKKKIDNDGDTLFDEEDSLDKGRGNEKKPLKKRKAEKMQSERGEKRKTRKIKNETPVLSVEINELDDKLKQEYADRIRKAKEIDSFELLVEEVAD